MSNLGIKYIIPQFGVPISVLRDGLPKLKTGDPAGPLGAALAAIAEACA